MGEGRLFVLVDTPLQGRTCGMGCWCVSLVLEYHTFMNRRTLLEYW